MKTILVLALLCGLAGCESENSYGKCVGVAQTDRRDPALIYDLSIWNAFWGVIGIEMIFPPILVLHHELYCPTGRRAIQPTAPGANILGETLTK